jgi:hypothetical protein
MAEAAGWRRALTIRDGKGLNSGVKQIVSGAGPVFANIKVKADRESGVLPPRDGAYLMRRFRYGLLGDAAGD